MKILAAYQDPSTGHNYLMDHEAQKKVLHAGIGFNDFVSRIVDYIGKIKEPIQMETVQIGSGLWAHPSFEGDEMGLLKKIAESHNRRLKKH